MVSFVSDFELNINCTFLLIFSILITNIIYLDNYHQWLDKNKGGYQGRSVKTLDSLIWWPAYMINNGLDTVGLAFAKPPSYELSEQLPQLDSHLGRDRYLKENNEVQFYFLVTPRDATVVILNSNLYYEDIGNFFQNPFRAKPGIFEFQASKKGYKTKRFSATFEAGLSRRSLLLEKITPDEERVYEDLLSKKKQGFLLVKVSDDYARSFKVRLLDSDKSFHQGIMLDVGDYKVEVNPDGYEKFIRDVHVKPEGTLLYEKLSPKTHKRN